MEATIVHINKGRTGLVRSTCEADDEHTLAERIQAAIDKAESEGHNVKIMVDDHVGTLLACQGYVSFIPINRPETAA
ncbi:MAG: hypothetical protein OXG04_11390 [Acidobacteria bacterium]|nr:hypothetical protein [Acidobacteriota bacterium]